MRKLSVVWLLFFCSSVLAKGDGGLYADVAPAGSTFIRVINTSAADPIKFTVGSFNFQPQEFCVASNYIFLPAGTISAASAGAKIDHKFNEDTFYTLVFNQSGIDVVEDTYFENKRKALVALYNFVEGATLSLKAKNGAVEVVEGTQQGQHKDREINSVTMQFELFQGGDLMLKLKEQSFARGEVYSAIACGSKNKPVANWSKLAIDSPAE